MLKAGRCTHKEPAGISEEEKEEYMTKLNEEDKSEERFKAINENKPVEGREDEFLIIYGSTFVQYVEPFYTVIMCERDLYQRSISKKK